MGSNRHTDMHSELKESTDTTCVQQHVICLACYGLLVNLIKISPCMSTAVSACICLHLQM